MELPEIIKPEGVYVADLHSLMDLGNAIVYAGEASASLRQAVDGYFTAVEHAMDRRIQEFEAELRRAQEALSQANAALSSCRQNYRYDEDGNRIEPNCSCEERDVREAEKEVKRIQEILDKLRNIRSELGNEFYEYRLPWGILVPGGGDSVLDILSDGVTRRATDSMQEVVELVKEYRRVNCSQGGGYVPDPGADLETPEQTVSKREKLREATARVQQLQRDDDYGSRAINRGNAVALCSGCHRPPVACTCGRDPLQREMFDYQRTR